MHVAKTKALISFMVTPKLICVFDFAYAKICFSHDVAHIMMDNSGGMSVTPLFHTFHWETMSIIYDVTMPANSFPFVLFLLEFYNPLNN